MRIKAPKESALSEPKRLRLRALCDAAEGCDWDSREVVELSRYYRSLDEVPWYFRSRVDVQLVYRELGGVANAEEFIAGMHRLSRCIDFGEPYPCGECEGCRGRERMNALIGQYHTFEQQQEYEAMHGRVHCQCDAKFEEGS